MDEGFWHNALINKDTTPLFNANKVEKSGVEGNVGFSLGAGTLTGAIYTAAT